MNPRIPATGAELVRWLQAFAASHAKRENPRIEALVDRGGEGEAVGPYRLRLVLGDRASPVVELGEAEVADGRTRFAWCEALAARVGEQARELAATARGGGGRSA